MDSKIVVELREGNDDAVQKVILEFMGMAKQVAKKFAYRFPNRTDDLLGVAYAGLVDAAMRARTNLVDNNISPYLYKNIWGACKKFVDRDFLIAIEPSAFKKLAEKHGDVSFVPMVFTYEEGETYYDQDGNEHHKPVNAGSNLITDWSRDSDSFKSNDDCEYLFEDLLRFLNLDDTEKAIVYHRREGKSLREIGEDMGVSKQYVGQIIERIKNKCLSLGIHLISQAPSQESDPS